MLNDILKNTKTIAIIGLSPNEFKTSNYIAKYLQEKKYKIIPIYPKEEFILNEKVYRNLNDINEKIDMVIMFRKGEYADNILQALLDKKIKTLWLPLGIFNENANEFCKKYNINFIQNLCIQREMEKLGFK